MHKAVLEPAFVLHRRPYGETSCLVEVFTLHYGRVTLLARGVRSLRCNKHGLLQPFIPLIISWRGKQDLMTLTEVECAGHSQLFQGAVLLAGLYLNELLMRLIKLWDSHPVLYQHYAQTLKVFCQHPDNMVIALRTFEQDLLAELGYALFPATAALLQQQFMSSSYYHFALDQGFVPVHCSPVQPHQNNPTVFLGKDLLAIAQATWTPHVLHEAKRLMRLVFSALLNGQPIHSRRMIYVDGKNLPIISGKE